MKLLAIETSSLVASAALIEDESIIAEYSVNHKKTHSQTLLPMIDTIVKEVGIELSELDAIAVAKGPGSFTGLRIGSATAKGLAQALNIPIIPVPTTAAMAYRIYGYQDFICPIMDARKQQVYTGVYTFKDGIFTTVMDQAALSIDELASWLNEQNRPVMILGDGVPPYKEILKDKLKVPYHFVPSHCNRQSAAAVGALGMELYQAGVVEKAEEHLPDYLRLSQAERELAERMKNHANS